MTARPRGGNPVPVGDLAAGLLDPVLRRRAGLSVHLIQAWSEIVGERLAPVTVPEKVLWPRRIDGDETFRPGTLVIACEAVAAMRLQHSSDTLIARVNAFLGYEAVDRLKIHQKPVRRTERPARAAASLDPADAARIDLMASGVDDEALRQSLARLGRSVFAQRKLR